MIRVPSLSCQDLFSKTRSTFHPSLPAWWFMHLPGLTVCVLTLNAYFGDHLKCRQQVSAKLSLGPLQLNHSWSLSDIWTATADACLPWRGWLWFMPSQHRVCCSLFGTSNSGWIKKEELASVIQGIGSAMCFTGVAMLTLRHLFTSHPARYLFTLPCERRKELCSALSCAFYAISKNIPLPIVFTASVPFVKYTNIHSSSLCFQCAAWYLKCHGCSKVVKKVNVCLAWINT